MKNNPVFLSAKRYPLYALTFIFFSFSFSLPPSTFALAVTTYDELLSAIRSTQHASEARIEQAVEQEKVREAWETGKLIDEHILLHKERAEYGDQVIIKLAKDLGMSETELKYRLQFARTYPIRQPADELSWSHYTALLSLNDAKEREAVTQEAVEKKWTRDQVREEVRRRSSPSLSLRGPEGRSNLSGSKPGKVSVYKVIEKNGKKYYDLGFSTYRRLLGNEPTKFKAGNHVFIKTAGPSYQPLAVRPNPADLYTYKAKAGEVVDGDTFHAMIDLGFGITVQNRLRLRSLDAPELVSADGKKAKEALEKILARDSGRIIIKTEKDPDQHGRYIADVWVKDKSITAELLETDLFSLRNNS